jgi:hypothetical protein
VMGGLCQERLMLGVVRFLPDSNSGTHRRRDGQNAAQARAIGTG